jgi:hypothetical protein
MTKLHFCVIKSVQVLVYDLDFMYRQFISRAIVLRIINIFLLLHINETQQ